MPQKGWYYSRDNQPLGPVDFGALRLMAANGELSPNDLVWSEGMPDWSPSSNVPEIWAKPVPTLPLPVGTLPVEYFTPSQQRFVYATFGQRFKAMLIDSFCIGSSASILTAGVLALAGYLPNGQVTKNALEFAIQLGAMLYFPLAECSERQATFGKRAMGLRVTNLQGGRISFLRACERSLAKIASYLTLMIGFLMANFTAKHQALHDMIAGTLVISDAKSRGIRPEIRNLT